MERKRLISYLFVNLLQSLLLPTYMWLFDFPFEVVNISLALSLIDAVNKIFDLCPFYMWVPILHFFWNHRSFYNIQFKLHQVLGQSHKICVAWTHRELLQVTWVRPVGGVQTAIGWKGNQGWDDGLHSYNSREPGGDQLELTLAKRGVDSEEGSGGNQRGLLRVVHSSTKPAWEKTLWLNPIWHLQHNAMDANGSYTQTHIRNNYGNLRNTDSRAPAQGTLL